MVGALIIKIIHGVVGSAPTKTSIHATKYAILCLNHKYSLSLYFNAFLIAWSKV